ncbi:hypothetical protein BH24BAC1_BH24BAC1_23000 [soil metagenome]
MNKTAFLHLIRHASSISAQEAEELEELVVNFPYCQTAHLLIAKAAYDRGSMLSNQKLRKAASYATNRQLLKKLIYTTSADVTLREVWEPTVAEEAQVPDQEVLPSAAAETAPAPVGPEQVVEGQQETPGLASEPQETPVLDPAAEAMEEPGIGHVYLEEVEAEGKETPAQEPILEEPVTEPDPIAEPELPVSDPAQDDNILVFAHAPEPAEGREEETGEAFEPGAKEENEEMYDELAGLLYIDRIMPYRPALPEQVESTEKAKEPIPLPQFANPSLTDEEVAALEEFFKPKGEEEEATGVWAEEAVPPEEAPYSLKDLPGKSSETAGEEEKERDLGEEEPVEEETLSRFDAFLFHPERDAPEQLPLIQEEEEVMATYPADVIDRIYAQNQLGYWMNSSRLGESLEVKNELTSAYPFHFHPELILEYVQVNEVEKQVKPADSPLDRQLDLIDQFLKINPRLKQFGEARLKLEPQEDLSIKSSKIKKSLASENLASIFLKQGKIKKAIKIYEHLIVKIPEKKAYFADQIQKLKGLT